MPFPTPGPGPGHGRSDTFEQTRIILNGRSLVGSHGRPSVPHDYSENRYFQQQYDDPMVGGSFTQHHGPEDRLDEMQMSGWDQLDVMEDPLASGSFSNKFFSYGCGA